MRTKARPAISAGPLAGAGFASLSLSQTIPSGAMPGLIRMQAFIGDAGAAGGFSNSNGSDFEIQ